MIITSISPYLCFARYKVPKAIGSASNCHAMLSGKIDKKIL